MEKGHATKARDIAGAMISCKIKKTLEVLQEKTLDDLEMEEDLALIHQKLQEVELSLSSFDEFW